MQASARGASVQIKLGANLGGNVQIYDSAGAGAYMPYANVTVGASWGAITLREILGDNGQWLLADMAGSNIDVAIHYCVSNAALCSGRIWRSSWEER